MVNQLFVIFVKCPQVKTENENTKKFPSYSIKICSFNYLNYMVVVCTLYIGILENEQRKMLAKLNSKLSELKGLKCQKISIILT